MGDKIGIISRKSFYIIIYSSTQIVLVVGLFKEPPRFYDGSYIPYISVQRTLLSRYIWKNDHV